MIGCGTTGITMNIHESPNASDTVGMVPAMISMIGIAAAAAPEKSSSDSHHGRIHPRYSQWPVPRCYPGRSLEQKQRWTSAEAKAKKAA